MKTLWTRNNKILISPDGKLLFCENCPCGCPCPNLLFICVTSNTGSNPGPSFAMVFDAPNQRWIYSGEDCAGWYFKTDAELICKPTDSQVPKLLVRYRTLSAVMLYSPGFPFGIASCNNDDSTVTSFFPSRWSCSPFSLDILPFNGSGFYHLEEATDLSCSPTSDGLYPPFLKRPALFYICYPSSPQFRYVYYHDPCFGIPDSIEDLGWISKLYWNGTGCSYGFPGQETISGSGDSWTLTRYFDNGHGLQSATFVSVPPVIQSQGITFVYSSSTVPLYKGNPPITADGQTVLAVATCDRDVNCQYPPEVIVTLESSCAFLNGLTATLPLFALDHYGPSGFDYLGYLAVISNSGYNIQLTLSCSYVTGIWSALIFIVDPGPNPCTLADGQTDPTTGVAEQISFTCDPFTLTFAGTVVSNLAGAPITSGPFATDCGGSADIIFHVSLP